MSINYDDVTAQCEDMISSLVIPRPFDLDRFLNTLSEQRGRRIELVAADLGTDQPCGMLISTDTTDYIYRADDLSPLQSQHTIMHEVGHLLFDHGTTRESFGGESATVTGEDALALLLPSLSPTLVRRILGRTVYGSQQEHEAELFATLVLTRVCSSRAVYTGSGPTVARGLARLEAAFGHPIHVGGRRG